MASPFEDTLDEIIVYTGTTLVSLETIQTCQGYLSDQEGKVRALSRGLTQSLMDHYEKGKRQKGSAEVRVAIVDMLTSLSLLPKGRTALLKTPIGRERLLKILKDPVAQVRAAGCKLFSSLSVFPDVLHVMEHGGAVVRALVKVLLKDDLEVARETIPALSRFSMTSSEMEEATMRGLLGLLTTQPSLHEGVLQTLWNTCKENNEKELAISCNAVPELCSLLDSPNRNIQRLVVGCLMAISVAESGKKALIEQEDAIPALVSFNEDDSNPDLQTNARMTLRNVVENPEGLSKAGALLVSDCEVMISTLRYHEISRLLDSYLSPSNEHLIHSLKGMMALCKTEEGRDALWNIVEVVQRLYEILTTSNDTHAKGLSKKVLSLLVASHPDAKDAYDSIDKQEEGGDVLGQPGAPGPLKASETAILLCQYQNDFLDKKGVAAASVAESLGEGQMLWCSADLVEKARKLGVAIVHLPMVLGDGSSDGLLKSLNGAFKKDSWGAEIVDELSPEDGDVVIVSSGLSAFENPLLEEELRNRGVRDVLVCGMSGDVGVESLMRDAYEKGFNVFAVADCIASSSNEAQKVLLEESLPMIGITVTTHKEAFKLLQG